MKKNACWELPTRVPSTLYHPQGCPACNHKGFRGRTAIHELIVVDPTLRDLIDRQAGSWSWNVMSVQTLAGIRSNGIEKVLAGETSLMKCCG
ncbi:hypothetical protein ACLB1N_20285 [Escherichia coli]